MTEDGGATVLTLLPSGLTVPTLLEAAALFPG